MLCVSTLIIAASVVQADIIQTAEYNGHTYYLLEEASWHDSEVEAMSLGGHLVTINDAEEDAWVYATFKDKAVEALGGDPYGGSLWIGYQDQDGDKTWEWLSGEPVTYINWSAGQPQGSDNEIFCGIFLSDWYTPLGEAGKWHDIADPEAEWDRALGIVEVPVSVTIDIKPGTSPNPLNFKNKGILPVAILGSEDFDIFNLDPVSVRLEGIAPIRSSYEDVSTFVVDTENGFVCATEGPDGYLDLTLKFDTQEIINTLGYVEDDDILLLTLTVKDNDGVLRAGTDCVIIIKENKALVGRWKLDEKSGSIAYDSSDNGYDGEVYGDLLWQPKSGILGGALLFDGDKDYVSLPIGSLISHLTNCTIATWVNCSTLNPWERIFDFGTGEAVNMFLTPSNGDTGTPRFAITTSGGGGEERVTAPESLSSGWHHVCVSINADAGIITLYLEGLKVAENNTTTLTPSDLGITSQNWLGRSQYEWDADFNGMLDDFRIYNQALSEEEIEKLHGI